MQVFFFYKCNIIKVTKQIVNPMIAFAANFKALKIESK